MSKALFVALIASLAVGCAAEPVETLAEGEAALETACPAEVSRPVVIPLDDVADLRCVTLHGQFLQLEWEGRVFREYVADHREVCQEEVAKLRKAAWEHHGLRGVLLERCTAASSAPTFSRTLVLENQWTLRQWD